jgi:hypothetical protein
VKPLLNGDDNPVSTDFDSKYWLKIGSNLLIYDYKHDCFTKYKFPDIPKCFHVTPDYKLYFGTAAGVMESKGETFNGTVIQSFFVGRDIDMGRRSQKKKIKKVYAYYKKQSTGDRMYIQFGTNEVGYVNPVIIEYTDGYIEWGTGLWGQLWGGSDSPGQQTYNISDKNNYFRIKIGSTTNPFEFYGYGVVYKLKPVR